MKTQQDIALNALYDATLRLRRAIFKPREIQYDHVSRILREALGAEHCSIFDIRTPQSSDGRNVAAFRLRLIGEYPRDPQGTRTYRSRLHNSNTLYLPIPKKPARKCGLLGWIAYSNELFHETGNALRNNRYASGRPPSHLKSRRAETLLVIPLQDRKENLLGLIKIENKLDRYDDLQLGRFSNTQVLCAQVLAATFAAVLENRRHIYAFRELIDGLSVSETLHSEAYKLIVHQAKRLFLANRGDLCIFDQTNEQLIKVAASESHHVFPSILFEGVPAHPKIADSFPVNCTVPKDSFIWSVWEKRMSRSPHRVASKINPKRPPRDYRFADSRTRSEMAVVLFERSGSLDQPRGKPFGVLNLESFREGYFNTQEDLRVLQRFAPYASVVSQYVYLMRRQRDDYQNLLNNLVEGVCRTTPQGEYLLVNRALKEMYGFDTEDELKKQNAGSLYVSMEDRERLLQQLRSGNGQVTGFEFPAWKRTNGLPEREQIWVRQNVRLRKSSPSFPVDILDATLEDVTKWRHITQIILASAISTEHLHNTISPANKILGEAKKFKEFLKPNLIPTCDFEIVNTHVNKIMSAAEQISSTAHDVRRFLNQELGEREAVDLSQIVREIGRDYEADFSLADLRFKPILPRSIKVLGYRGMLLMFFTVVPQV